MEERQKKERGRKGRKRKEKKKEERDEKGMKYENGEEISQKATGMFPKHLKNIYVHPF